MKQLTQSISSYKGLHSLQLTLRHCILICALGTTYALNSLTDGKDVGFQLNAKIPEFDRTLNAWKIDFDRKQIASSIILPFVCPANLSCDVADVKTGMLACMNLQERLCAHGWVHERVCKGGLHRLCGNDTLDMKARYFSYNTNHSWMNVQTPLEIVIPRNKEMELRFLQPQDTQKRINILLVFLQIRDSIVSVYKYELTVFLHEPGLQQTLISLQNPCMARGLEVPRHALAVEVQNAETPQCIWKCHWRFMRVPWNAKMKSVNQKLDRVYDDNLCRPIPENFVSVRWSVNVGQVESSYGVLGDAWLKLADDVASMIHKNFSIPIVASACTIKGSVTADPDYDFMLAKFSSQNKNSLTEYEVHKNAQFLFEATGEWERVMDCIALASQTDLQPSHASRSVSRFVQSLPESGVFERNQFAHPESLEHDVESVSRLASNVEMRRPVIDVSLQRLIATAFEIIFITAAMCILNGKRLQKN